MKIGMILDSDFPPDPRVENEAVSLIKAGHDVYLYAFSYDKSNVKNETINGIKVHRHYISNLTFKSSALAYTIPYYHIKVKKSIIKFAKDYHIEALHVHDIQIARAVFNANKKLNLHITLDLHENRPEIMKYYSHVKSKLGKFLIFPEVWKKFEYKYIRKADKVIVVTEEAKAYYLNEIGTKEDKIYVVPNTVRQAFYNDFNLNQKIVNRYKNSFTLLYIGDTGLRRGIQTMIKSLKYILPSIPNLKLVVVGKNKTDYQLQNLVKELGHEKYVDLEGWQNFELFQSYIFASNIGTCPIHKNIHHDTTYANKIFQYMAFGKPIVVSNCDAQVKVIEDYNCGLVFNDRDEKDFADKILTLYNNQTLLNDYSKNATKAIEESLNWSKKSIELINLYNEIKDLKPNK